MADMNSSSSGARAFGDPAGPTRTGRGKDGPGDSEHDQIERASQRLRQKDVSELLEDAQRLARRQPGLVVGTAFVTGKDE